MSFISGQPGTGQKSIQQSITADTALPSLCRLLLVSENQRKQALLQGPSQFFEGSSIHYHNFLIREKQLPLAHNSLLITRNQLEYCLPTCISFLTV